MLVDGVAFATAFDRARMFVVTFFIGAIRSLFMVLVTVTRWDASSHRVGFLPGLVLMPVGRIIRRWLRGIRSAQQRQAVDILRDQVPRMSRPLGNGRAISPKPFVISGPITILYHQRANEI